MLLERCQSLMHRMSRDAGNIIPFCSRLNWTLVHVPLTMHAVAVQSMCAVCSGLKKSALSCMRSLTLVYVASIP
jgi:hypothetical protein